MVYQFKIQLEDVTNPPVWRRVMVPEKFTFEQFHQLIHLAFGWEGYHLYQFSPTGYGSQPLIGIPSGYEFDVPDMNAKKTKLNQVFTQEKQTFNYLYDFGDSWSHHIVLEKLLPDTIKIPVCVAGKGACPPEDCGGAYAYEDLKTILANPSHEEYEEMKEWLGMEDDEKWDAGAFDMEEVNGLLKEWFGEGGK